MITNAPAIVQGKTTDIEEWRRAVSQTFVPLAVEAPPRTDFGAQVHGRVSDGVLFSTIHSTEHTVERTAEHIAASPVGYVKLTLQLSGSGVLVQDDRRAALAPGDIVLYDTSRPYTLEFSDALTAVVIMFPHRLIDVSPETLRALTAIRIDGQKGFARAVSHFLAGLVTALPTLDASTGLLVTHNTMDLVATMIGHELRGAGWDPSADLLFQIDAYINAHLCDPELDPSSIATANYISTRRLHALFQRRGTTVSHWVRQRRLDHVRRDLTDTRLTGQSIGTIATRWGFRDASHFSKAFKKYEGISPTEFRASRGTAPPGI